MALPSAAPISTTNISSTSKRRGGEAVVRLGRLELLHQVMSPQDLAVLGVHREQVAPGAEPENPAATDHRRGDGPVVRPVMAGVGFTEGVAPQLVAGVHVERRHHILLAGGEQGHHPPVSHGHGGVARAQRPLPAHLQAGGLAREQPGIAHRAVEVRAAQPGPSGICRRRLRRQDSGSSGRRETTPVSCASLSPCSRLSQKVQLVRRTFWHNRSPRGAIDNGLSWQPWGSYPLGGAAGSTHAPAGRWRSDRSRSRENAR